MTTQLRAGFIHRTVGSVPLAPGHAVVTTDGSCYSNGRESLGLPANRGCGGWAAVVELRSEGELLRGRVAETTATRMELLAVERGLAWLPAGCQALVVSDALIVPHVRSSWLQRLEPARSALPEDRELWLALYAQFDRVGRVEFRYVKKRDRVSAHERTHVIAGAEARALAVELGQMPGNAKKPRSRVPTVCGARLHTL